MPPYNTRYIRKTYTSCNEGETPATATAMQPALPRATVHQSLPNQETRTVRCDHSCPPLRLHDSRGDVCNRPRPRLSAACYSLMLLFWWPSLRLLCLPCALHADFRLSVDAQRLAMSQQTKITEPSPLTAFQAAMPTKLRRLLPCFTKSKSKMDDDDEGIEITRLSSTTTSPNPAHQLPTISPPFTTAKTNGAVQNPSSPAQTTWPYRGCLKPPSPPPNTNNSVDNDTDIDAIHPIRPKPSYSNIKLAAQDRKKLFEMLRDPEKAPARKASHGVLAAEERGRAAGEAEWAEIVQRGKDGGAVGGDGGRVDEVSLFRGFGLADLRPCGCGLDVHSC